MLDNVFLVLTDALVLLPTFFFFFKSLREQVYKHLYVGIGTIYLKTMTPYGILSINQFVTNEYFFSLLRAFCSPNNNVHRLMV